MTKDKSDKTQDDLTTDSNIAIDSVASEIVNKNLIKTMKDNLEMWLYYPQLKHWKPDAKNMILTACSKNPMVNNKQGSVLKTVQGFTLMQREAFVTPDGLLNLKNCVLDINTNEVKEHSPDYYFKGVINTDYEPKADCSTFKKLISDALPNEQDRITIQKYCGYMLDFKHAKKEKSLVAVGRPHSSKSTIFGAIIKIIGKENIVNYSIQDLNDDKWAVSYLYGKLANICFDMGQHLLKDVGMYKVATGQDQITGRYPHSPNIFQFDSVAKFLFITNKLPRLAEAVEMDEAFWRRIMVIRFLIVHKEVDENMRDKLDSELSGILNWMIEGYHMLQKDGHFSYEKEPFDEWVEDLEQTSPIIDWFNEHLMTGDDNYVVIDSALHFYLKWCEEKKIDAIKPGRFYRAMKRDYGAQKDSRHLNGENKSTAIYTGICWKPEVYQKVLDYQNGTKSNLPEITDENILIEYIRNVISMEFNLKDRPPQESRAESDIFKVIATRINVKQALFESAYDKVMDILFNGVITVKVISMP